MNENFKDEIHEQATKLELFESVMRRIYDDVFKYSVSNYMADSELAENDFSSLSVGEIIGKIRDVVASNPSDVNLLIFIRYLAVYPVSMCKRDVSPDLARAIGFHYRFGVPTKEQEANGVKKVSYEDLSEIFGRSKATISDCVNKTESGWNELQAKIQMETDAEEQAKRELVAEKKAKLREMEQNNQTVEQTTERTPIPPSGEDNAALI
jgi:predicted DNA-binding protein YlxM (UPF0122 family)